ncbi:MAG: hypothetical protein VX185_12600 [Pseudomonadota bacterium]|nr:hypothetical protein [Pseudomonadota bacterium]
MLKYKMVTFLAYSLVVFGSSNLMAQTPLNSTEIRIPVEAELQRLLLAADKFLSSEDFATSQSYLDRAESLNIELPANYYYFKASIETHHNNWSQARFNYEEYILRSTPEDKYYVKSLEMITQIENRIALTPITETEQETETAPAPEITWDSVNSVNAQDEYIDKISKLYLTDAPSDALVNHINTLLSSTPYNAAAAVVPSSTRIQTSISLEGTDKIRVQKTMTQDGDTQITAFSTSVYGLSREFVTRCEAVESKCTVKHKDSLSTWFEIGNDEAAALEISEALSALIYTLQKNNRA